LENSDKSSCFSESLEKLKAELGALVPRLPEDFQAKGGEIATTSLKKLLEVLRSTRSSCTPTMQLNRTQKRSLDEERKYTLFHRLEKQNDFARSREIRVFEGHCDAQSSFIPI